MVVPWISRTGSLLRSVGEGYGMVDEEGESPARIAGAVYEGRVGKGGVLGEVVGVGRSREYLIKLPSGRVMWRNRRFF